MALITSLGSTSYAAQNAKAIAPHGPTLTNIAPFNSENACVEIANPNRKSKKGDSTSFKTVTLTVSLLKILPDTCDRIIPKASKPTGMVQSANLFRK